MHAAVRRFPAGRPDRRVRPFCIGAGHRRSCLACGVVFPTPKDAHRGPYYRHIRQKEKSTRMKQALVGVVMGSSSDWETLEHAARTLEELGVPHEVRVVSAHRTPDLLFEYASSAEERGLEVIIAGAGGAAHLPGMIAAKTALPVLGVPVQSKALNGLDSLLSIVQMPAGIAVGTLAIGRSGAVNAALLAVQILGNKYAAFREAVREYRSRQSASVLSNPDPREKTL